MCWISQTKLLHRLHRAAMYMVDVQKLVGEIDQENETEKKVTG